MGSFITWLPGAGSAPPSWKGHCWSCYRDGAGLGNRLLLSALCLLGTGTGLPSLLCNVCCFSGLLSVHRHLCGGRLRLRPLQRGRPGSLVQPFHRRIRSRLYATVSLWRQDQRLGLQPFDRHLMDYPTRARLLRTMGNVHCHPRRPNDSGRSRGDELRRYQRGKRAEQRLRRT